MSHRLGLRRLAAAVIAGSALTASLVGPTATAAVEKCTALSNDPTRLKDSSFSTEVGAIRACGTFTTDKHYWSVISIRPKADGSPVADYDLMVADGNASQVVGRSNYGGNAVDFVAINSNLRQLSYYVAKASLYNGHGSVTMSLSDHGRSLAEAPSPVYTSSTSATFTEVRDVWLTAGQCLAVRASNLPRSVGSMHLMASNPTDPATFVRNRAQAAATVDYSPADASKTLTYTAPQSGWYGLVVSNDHIGPLDALMTYQRVSC